MRHPGDANGKVWGITDLSSELSTLRSQDPSNTVVQCHGVFDLLHIGHIRHFEQAKGMGDTLVVTLTPDRYVNKGANRPAFPETLRAEALASLDCVDYVAITDWPTAVESIQLIQPDIYAKGSDYKNHDDDVTGMIVEEEKAVTSLGGRIAYTDDIVFSSSNLINKYLPIFPPEVTEYLAGFSSRHSSDEVIGYLRAAQTLKTLVIGETIIDEYQYCEFMGKAGKEPILAGRYAYSDVFAGGILAVANHVANFCGDVGVATMLGDSNTQEKFVRDRTNARFDMMCLKADSPTIVKRRFVDRYLLQKVFEVYEMNDEELSESQNLEICSKLEEILPRYDVVIVVDYGHGMLTHQAIEILSSRARFLAVNTQSNSGNRGFNIISKYPRADFISLAEPEIALEERKNRGDYKEMILSVSEKLHCGRVIVTRGKDGIVCYGAGEGFVEVPAFAGQVVDRVGAGDAVLSLTALCAVQRAPMEILGLVGNVAGAEAVATLGHTSSIQQASFFKHIETLLK